MQSRYTLTFYRKWDWRAQKKECGLYVAHIYINKYISTHIYRHIYIDTYAYVMRVGETGAVGGAAAAHE